MCVFWRRNKTIKLLLRKKHRSYSEKEFERIFDILERLSWVRDRESQLDELLYSLLKDEQERDLIEELLGKVIYLDDNESRTKTKEIAKHITDVWKCSEEDSIIVGANMKENSDGSAVLSYELRNVLEWKESRFKITCKNIQNDPNVKNIVIVDDFIGSGKRMHDIIKYIRTRVSDVRIFFASICLMESVVKRCYPDVLECTYFAPIILTPGMNYTNDKRMMLMTKIEAYLAPRWKKYSLELYHLGYEESGALYWNRHYRVPNNVYPVFWWGERKDGTVFHSLMGEL